MCAKINLAIFGIRSILYLEREIHMSSFKEAMANKPKHNWLLLFMKANKDYTNRITKQEMVINLCEEEAVLHGIIFWEYNMQYTQGLTLDEDICYEIKILDEVKFISFIAKEKE